jgi:outer membrane protein OmpA-like peptidoglycan-associated protein
LKYYLAVEFARVFKSFNFIYHYNLFTSPNYAGIANPLSGPTNIMNPTPVPPQPGNSPSSERSMLSRLLPWIVLLIAALGLFYFVQNGCGSSNEKTETSETNTDGPKKDMTQVESDPASSVIKYTFSNKSTLELESKSAMNRILEVIRGSASGVGMSANTPNCASFEKVRLDANSRGLNVEAEPELLQLVTILKAYPEVIISLEGHTDNAGDPATNKAISERLATIIKNWCEGKGVRSEQLIASGWGDTNPLAGNDTAEGRKRNNRVEACVVKR